jgi:copper chaperone CopZ
MSVYFAQNNHKLIKRARGSGQMSKASAYFIVNNLDGKKDIKKIKSDLDKLSGVISVSMNTAVNSVAVDFDTTGIRKHQLFDKIEKLGYDVSESRYEVHIM